MYLSRKEAMDEMSSRTWQELKVEAKELIELSERLRELKQKLNPKINKDEEVEEGDNKEDVSEEIPDLVAGETVELTDKEKEEIQKEIKEIQEKMREVGPVRTCVVKHVIQFGAYITLAELAHLFQGRDILGIRRRR